LDAAIIVDVLMLHKNFSKLSLLVALCASHAAASRARAELAASGKLCLVTKVYVRGLYSEGNKLSFTLEWPLHYYDGWL